jgi:hypothetical protein
VIDKSGDYWHLYYNETLENPSAAQILEKVEELFSEIAQMGDVLYVRAEPSINRARNFSTDKIDVNIFCRLGSRPKVEREIPEILGFGRIDK